MNRVFRLLNLVRLPDRPYYWLLDRLTDNDGWRPLNYAPRAWEVVYWQDGVRKVRKGEIQTPRPQ